MGVQGLRFLLKGAYGSTEDKIISHLYIDLPNLVHMSEAAHTSGGKWETYKIEVEKALNNIASTLKPKKSISIAIDGSPPDAKLVGKSPGHKAYANKWKETSTKAVERWAASFLPKNPHVTINFSSHRAKGEAELKMLKMLKENTVAVKGDVHVMVSDDQDVSLMLMISKLPNVFVYSHRTFSKRNMFCPTRLQPLLVKRMLAQFTVLQSHPAWREFSDPEWLKSDRSVSCMEGISRDLTMCVTIATGNDYLPPLHGLVQGGPDKLWNQYYDLRLQDGNFGRTLFRVRPPLPNSRAELKHTVWIDYDVLRRLICSCQARESDGAQVTAARFDATLLRTDSIHLPTLLRPDALLREVMMPNLRDVLADALDPGWDEYDSILSDREKERVAKRLEEQRPWTADIAERYLSGLRWTAEMYINGVCPDQYSTFDFPSPPTASDVLDFLDKTLKQDSESQGLYAPDYTSPILKCSQLVGSEDRLNALLEQRDGQPPTCSICEAASAELLTLQGSRPVELLIRKLGILPAIRDLHGLLEMLSNEHQDGQEDVSMDPALFCAPVYIEHLVQKQIQKELKASPETVSLWHYSSPSEETASKWTRIGKSQLKRMRKTLQQEGDTILVAGSGKTPVAVKPSILCTCDSTIEKHPVNLNALLQELVDVPFINPTDAQVLCQSFGNYIGDRLPDSTEQLLRSTGSQSVHEFRICVCALLLDSLVKQSESVWQSLAEHPEFIEPLLQNVGQLQNTMGDLISSASSTSQTTQMQYAVEAALRLHQQLSHDPELSLYPQAQVFAARDNWGQQLDASSLATTSPLSHWQVHQGKDTPSKKKESRFTVKRRSVLDSQMSHQSRPLMDLFSHQLSQERHPNQLETPTAPLHDTLLDADVVNVPDTRNTQMTVPQEGPLEEASSPNMKTPDSPLSLQASATFPSSPPADDTGDHTKIDAVHLDNLQATPFDTVPDPDAPIDTQSQTPLPCTSSRVEANSEPTARQQNRISSDPAPSTASPVTFHLQTALTSTNHRADDSTVTQSVNIETFETSLPAEASLPTGDLSPPTDPSNNNHNGSSMVYAARAEADAPTVPEMVSNPSPNVAEAHGDSLSQPSIASTASHADDSTTSPPGRSILVSAEHEETPDSGSCSSAPCTDLLLALALAIQSNVSSPTHGPPDGKEAEEETPPDTKATNEQSSQGSADLSCSLGSSTPTMASLLEGVGDKLQLDVSPSRSARQKTDQNEFFWQHGRRVMTRVQAMHWATGIRWYRSLPKSSVPDSRLKDDEVVLDLVLCVFPGTKDVFMDWEKDESNRACNVNPMEPAKRLVHFCSWLFALMQYDLGYRIPCWTKMWHLRKVLKTSTARRKEILGCVYLQFPVPELLAPTESLEVMTMLTGSTCTVRLDLPFFTGAIFYKHVIASFNASQPSSGCNNDITDDEVVLALAEEACPGATPFYQRWLADKEASLCIPKVLVHYQEWVGHEEGMLLEDKYVDFFYWLQLYSKFALGLFEGESPFDEVPPVRMDPEQLGIFTTPHAERKQILDWISYQPCNSGDWAHATAHQGLRRMNKTLPARDQGNVSRLVSAILHISPRLFFAASVQDSWYTWEQYLRLRRPLDAQAEDLGPMWRDVFSGYFLERHVRFPGAQPFFSRWIADNPDLGPSDSLAGFEYWVWVNAIWGLDGPDISLYSSATDLRDKQELAVLATPLDSRREILAWVYSVFISPHRTHQTRSALQKTLFQKMNFKGFGGTSLNQTGSRGKNKRNKRPKQRAVSCFATADSSPPCTYVHTPYPLSIPDLLISLSDYLPSHFSKAPPLLATHRMTLSTTPNACILPIHSTHPATARKHYHHSVFNMSIHRSRMNCIACPNRVYPLQKAGQKRCANVATRVHAEASCGTVRFVGS